MRRASALGLALLLCAATGVAQQVTTNVNVLPVYSDPDDPLSYLKGDEYLQRQVEPTVAVSTRNPDHLITFFNDYRAVDAPDDPGMGTILNVALKVARWAPVRMLVADALGLDGLAGLVTYPTPAAHAEAWVGMSRSYDGGLTWSGGMLPGGPFDATSASLASPVRGMEAATDPVAAAAPCGYVYTVFVAFTRGGESRLAVARYQDLADVEGGDTWVYQGTTVLESGNNATHGYFLDKPHIAVDVTRDGTGGACGHRVYVSYTTFNGLDKEGKFQSKLTVARSSDLGGAWDLTKFNMPYNQNQGTAIAVDPRPGTPGTGGGGAVYLVWRHFYAPDMVLMTRSVDFGSKFSKPVELTAGTTMAPYDQPTMSTELYGFETGFRSNGFPTVAVTGSGAVFAAWQERVDVTEGSPTFGTPRPGGSPRIVMVRSTDGGATWTDVAGAPGTRRAVDAGPRLDTLDPLVVPEEPESRRPGPQLMPKLSSGGGRLLLVFTESRGRLGVDALTGEETVRPEDLSGSTGAASGYDRVFDFRGALLDPVTGQLERSFQISRYPVRADADLGDGLTAGDLAAVNPPCSPDQDALASGLPPCVRQLARDNAPQSAAGTSPFIGDYPDATPLVQFVPDGEGGWRWATDAADMPSPGFHVVWSDNRHLVPPTVPGTFPEWLRYPTYDPPGTGKLSCYNPGSRNTDVLTARVDAGLMLSAPVLAKPTDVRRAFPLSVSNRTADTRTYRLEITEGAGDATFSAAGQDIDAGEVVVFPYSTISQTVYVDAGAVGPVRIVVTDITPPGGGETASVVFNAGADGASVPDPGPLEVQDPFVVNPFVVNPFVVNPFVVNPFVVNSGSTNFSLSNPFVVNPFVVNPFVVNPFVVNPFVVNPFVVNPFVVNSTIHDVVDTTWTVEAGGNTATSYVALPNIDNAEAFLGDYAFQLIISKAAAHGVADGCEPLNAAEEQVLSSVSQEPNPFVVNPFVVNPFVVNPFVVNPFVVNPTPEDPFVVNPFVVNSTFTLAPSESGATAKSGVGDLRAPRAPDRVQVTLRAYQLTEHPVFRFDPVVDPPSMAIIALGCDTSDPTATCYDARGPDLVPEGLPPGLELQAEVGGTVLFPGWTLANRGNATAQAENLELRHGVYVSCGEEWAVLEPAFESARDPVPSGSEVGFEGLELTLPDCVTAGEHSLVLHVDDLREVSEVDETNNASEVIRLVVVEPNLPPEASDMELTTAEDDVLTAWLTATDPDGDALTFVIDVGPAMAGTVVLVDASTGELRYTPPADWSGVDTFSFHASDGELTSAPATVTIEVLALNDAPVALPDLATAEQNGGPITIDVLANDSDVDGDALSIVSAGGGAVGSVSVDGALVVYTPEVNFVGVDEFSYVVSDPSGASASATVTVTVADPVPDWGFLGLLDPWREEPLYLVNVGSAVPLKWSYTDLATGAVLPTPEAWPEVRVKGPFPCSGDEDGSALEVVHDPGESGYQYDAKRSLHQFNWETTGLEPGCYHVRVYCAATHQLDGPFRIGLE